MQKTVIIFVIAVLILISVILWAVNNYGTMSDILEISIVIILVGFAVYLGITRLKSLKRNEPAEDELSKKIMTKASSVSFYITIYMWLFVMYFSDRTTLEAHSIIGAGIAGMALIFFLSWMGIKIFGMKNE
jgi:hypothetical protein